MSATDILEFLRDPVSFANNAVDADIWDEALVDIATPLTTDQRLREAQVEAWKGLAKARVGLILGPPGTGKTHVLAWMAAAYLEARRRRGLPCRILVTAFTRDAIINLIEAIAKRCDNAIAARIVFAGREPSKQLELAEHLEIDAVAPVLAEPYVVIGTTVWGLNRLIREQGGFTGSFFHLTCIDEASQMVLSHGLMAIAGMAEQGRVLVAGDNRQLPPIRIEHEHDIDGRRLGSSLYAFLQAAGVPEFALDETFRLNEPLTRFPRDRFYDDRYRSADPGRKLELIDDWAEGLDDWERVAIDPAYPICVLIHDGPARGSSNPFEAMIAARLGRALFRRQPVVNPGAPDAEKWQERLAIVSPHRAQNKLIRDMLGDGLEGQGAVVETVDRIQGRERDAIVVSYTVSDPEFALAEAEFIFSPERLNVTVTRARTKLILIISRRLLEVVPSDEELVDKAETLREFVYRAQFVERITLTAPDNGRVSVDVCVLPFEDSVALPKINQPQRAKQEDLEPLTPQHLLLLDKIQQRADTNKWHTVADYDIARSMRNTAAEIFPDIRLLQRHGKISLDGRSGRQGQFWSIRPLPNPSELNPLSDKAFADRVEEAVMLAGRGRLGTPYESVRDAFDWLGESGDDLFKPALDGLEAADLVQYEMHNGRLYVSRPRPESGSGKTGYVPLDEALERGDWVLLNHLEDVEARSINFGVFEEWHAPIELANAVHVSLSDVTQALQRLDRHGLVLIAEEGRVRSRMAEMARAVRYVKQRFRKGDAADRPYLVRGVKVELRNREKPAYDTPLSDVVENIVLKYGDASAASCAAKMVAMMLRKTWRTESPYLAAFQARALTSIFNAWMSPGDNRFVIAADTGSGKTEAACLPIIAGTLHDRLNGVDGTRAIFVYPRVRLATNQSQRLARYLASMSAVEGAPVLTLGLQIGDVPEDWAKADPQIWEPTGRAGEYQFPFFTCPETDCGSRLTIVTGAGAVGADQLSCRQCGWHFDGWIGTKAMLRATPPNLFLPTTESLHQWLNDKRYGRLFGDLSDGPRAFLADEIHLYTHIQGAQVGYSLRRLHARISLNGAPPVAIGMSATLGRPGHVWQQLVGGSAATLIQPKDEERRHNPRGREYFYFIQPEIESRNRDVAGASTTIQAAMALAHNMHRRHGEEGGFRGIVFVDSIDKLKRLHGNYMDAEWQNLASLRTRLYPDHPATLLPQRQCCGAPLGCDIFTNGECWTFAATDRRQWTASGPYVPGNALTVARFPVYSGSGARIEEEIERSDLVFSTASLEVGYDDPDMAFVYQHYAPSNLASFIQRKGRGGRGNDDRPVTGVTLSLYSSRDSWFFNRPNELLDSRGFDVPLNLDNPIVVRGQLAALVLDLIARREIQSMGRIQADSELGDEFVTEFETVCDSLFNTNPFVRMGYANGKAFLVDLVKRFGRFQTESPFKRRARIGWVPNNLFGTANLPSINFIVPMHGGGSNECTESITLGLAASAPGNATRRWGTSEVHWRAPRQGRAAFLTAAEEAAAEKLDLGTGRDLLADLPNDAREDLGGEALADTVLCPTLLSLDLIGTARGGTWTPLVEWDSQSYSARMIPDNANSSTQIDIRSTGSLRGFPLVRASRLADPIEPGPLSRIVTAVGTYVGSSTRGTGLRLARLYWGADAAIHIVGQTEPLGVSQTFTDSKGSHAQLIGYEMESEGISFTLDSAAIDNFIEAEMLRLADMPAEKRWHRNQMLRYIVQNRARKAGINGYEARRAAELIVTAVDTPRLASELVKLVKMWSDTALAALFKLTYREALLSHPLLSERRIERLIATLTGRHFKELLLHVLDASESAAALRLFLRSQLLHSLAVRLHQSFVLYGKGDERSVLAHVKLPIQFGKRADDVITIVENGAGGDGTTRTFVEHSNEAFGAFVHGFADTCPNAAEDALLNRADAASDQHQAWRILDPRRPETLLAIGTALRINFETPEAPSPQQLLRVLYATETIAGHPFALYDIWREVMSTRRALTVLMARDPDAWEIVSAASRGAVNGSYPTLGAMLAAYGRIEDAVQDESLSPARRLADQIYRLCGRLCFDGCLAYLHGDSDLMPGGLAEVTVSRRLLARYLAASRSAG